MKCHEYTRYSKSHSDDDKIESLQSSSTEKLLSRDYVARHSKNRWNDPSDCVPGAVEIHHQLIDMYILKPKEGGVLSVKDVTTVPPKEGQHVLDSVLGHSITYTCEISTHSGKRRLTSRRDTEIVRAKKAFLRKYLRSRKHHSDDKDGKPIDYEARINYICSIMPSEDSESLTSDSSSCSESGADAHNRMSSERQQLRTRSENDAKANGIDNATGDDSRLSIGSDVRNSVGQDDGIDDDISVPGANNTSNWVKCDKCKIWRLLPSSVDLKTLEDDSWYCHMNIWDPKQNTCYVNGMIEEGRARHLAKILYWIGQDIGKYECTPETMSLIQCTHCFKLRPIPKSAKRPKNFVCAMNRWHYLLASCSAPQLDIYQQKKILTAEYLDACKPKESSTTAIVPSKPEKLRITLASLPQSSNRRKLTSKTNQLSAATANNSNNSVNTAVKRKGHPNSLLHSRKSHRK